MSKLYAFLLKKSIFLLILLYPVDLKPKKPSFLDWAFVDYKDQVFYHQLLRNYKLHKLFVKYEHHQIIVTNKTNLT
jgi:hypothetical protein